MYGSEAGMSLSVMWMTLVCCCIVLLGVPPPPSYSVVKGIWNESLGGGVLGAKQNKPRKPFPGALGARSSKFRTVGVAGSRISLQSWWQLGLQRLHSRHMRGGGVLHAPPLLHSREACV